MKIGLVYAMTGEIESLLTQENAQPLQTVAGVPFYQIRPDVIACAGGVSKVNAAMATQLLISLYQPDLVLNAGVAGCFENMPLPHRLGGHRRLVRHRHTPGPLDRRHLPPPAVRHGGLRRCPGVPAQQRAVHVHQVRVRLPV